MTIFGQLADRERRPVEARKKVREGSYTVHSCAHGLGPVWTANPYVDGSNPSVHLCLIRLTGEDRGFLILQ